MMSAGRCRPGRRAGSRRDGGGRSSDGASRLLRGLRRIFGSQEMVLFLRIVALLPWSARSTRAILAERNLQSIFLGNAYIAVAAIGMSMVIISGNIDISVGSLIGVLATLSGTLAVAGYPIIVSWLAPLVVGALATALMGFLVAYLRIPSIVVDPRHAQHPEGRPDQRHRRRLDHQPAGGLRARPDAPARHPDADLVHGRARPSPPRSGCATPRPAARSTRSAAMPRRRALSGISRRRTIMTVFVIHGVFVGIASVLFATQLSVIQSTVPPNLELTIITASVVGGVSILGGTGTVVGSTLAAILLAAIGSSLIFVNISPYWLRAVQGVLILITVLADLMRRRRQARAR